jgi:DNA-binding PadR family transcriptional regulator
MSEFEMFLVVAISALRDDAYGVSIRTKMREQTGRQASIGSIYEALDRMERAGLLTSRPGEPRPERGGRARRYFKITAAGANAYEEKRQTTLSVLRPVVAGAHVR